MNYAQIKITLVTYEKKQNVNVAKPVFIITVGISDVVGDYVPFSVTLCSLTLPMDQV